MARVLIVNMPFSNLRWPNIGPSLLKAALRRRKIDCDIAYFNFDFAELTGLDHYYWIADYFAFVLGGERLFAKHYFGDRLPDDESYYRDILLNADAELDDRERVEYERTIVHVEPFLDRCMSSTDWSRYDVVGFATSFQQTMPSICLARRIKQLRPDTRIVFGGAACEGEMGIELLARFAPIDYVFLGEADLTFAPVVEQILGGEQVELPPGVVGRETSSSQLRPAPDPHACMVRRMDDLPIPDFDDYFQRWRTSSLKDRIEPLLFFETSRGCWWGQKHHCAFCGLNGSTLTYRSKSPRRAVDELRYLVQRHDVHKGCSADNILDHRYFKTFLPMLIDLRVVNARIKGVPPGNRASPSINDYARGNREANLDLAFVYEMKTNMTRHQVDILLAAGLGAAQLGIETFITSVLKLIGKGANSVQNLQTLKWFSEAGIEVKWNVLYGFPGEESADYEAFARLIPSLYHLAPPQAAGRVRMDRFAPYFEDPAAHGMINPRPNAAFAYVYPFPPESHARLAYYYEYDYADGRNPLDYVAPALEAIATWQQLQGTVTLRQWDRSDGLLILTDTRPDAAEFQHRLTGIERAIYLFCDTGRSFGKITEMVAQLSEGQSLDEAALHELLDRWVEARIVALLDDRYLSLALRAPPDDGEAM